MPSLFSRHAVCLSFAVFGLAFSASAAAQTFLDELTVVSLSPQDKEALMNELFNDLNKDDDDQEAHVWDNAGAKAATVQAVYSFSNSGMTEHSLKAHVCRDLTMVCDGKNGKQELRRRSCENRYGTLDIEPDYEEPAQSGR